eukprot:9308165-Alexandrium_andersonii.AAC.1
MGDGVRMDDSHLRAFDPNIEQFNEEMEPDASWDDDTPLADLLPGRMRVPSPKPSQREIDLQEVIHTPYAEWSEIFGKTKTRGENRPRVDHAQRAENV